MFALNMYLIKGTVFLHVCFFNRVLGHLYEYETYLERRENSTVYVEILSVY